MDREVRVLIKGLHTDENDTSDVGIDVKGSYYYKGGKHYVCYEEISKDGEEKSKSILKLKSDKIEFIKKGFGETHLNFEEGKRYNTAYNTFVGDVFVGVDTRSIELCVEENGIRAKIDYMLLFDEQKAADCIVEIEIISEKSMISA